MGGAGRFIRTVAVLLFLVGGFGILATYMDVARETDSPAQAVFLLQVGLPFLIGIAVLEGLAQIIDLLAARFSHDDGGGTR
jgi:hypothetical protein